MDNIINERERAERIRKAVLRRGGDVTVGDIMSETGLGAEEAKAGLDALIKTHEGTMRVSEKGELVYAFARGCILRDQRSWWERNKKAIMGFVKGLFKIIIMLVLVVYFVIFLLILIALLFGNRSSSSSGNSSINLGGLWYIFWGTGSANPHYSGNRYKKDPLYTRVYNFVFGPEEEEIDPLEARAKCAQLIRAKNGVITVEDWIMISGQSRKKCESDLARYTAEFNGAAEITDNGTLVYVFEDMMTSTKLAQRDQLPSPAWADLEPPRPLSGNTEQNGGNTAVIVLNTFNLFMSFVIMFGLTSTAQSMANDPNLTLEEMALIQAGAEELGDYTLWLGIVPFVFSSLIFLGPLVRLPGNMRENRERRARSVRKAVLRSVFDKPERSATRVSLPALAKSTNQILDRGQLQTATAEEIETALGDIVDELDGELVGGKGDIAFERMDERLEDARKQRDALNLRDKSVGRVVYSTDQDEQHRIDTEKEKADMDEFDRMISESSKDYTPAKGGAIDPGNILDGLKSLEDGYDRGYQGKSSSGRKDRSDGAY